MAWDDNISCGHYGGVRGANHVCVCAEDASHDGRHQCTCGEKWENRAVTL